MKICSKCHIEKEATRDNFYKQASRKDGNHPWCKDCCKEYQKEDAPNRLKREALQWKNDEDYRKRRLELQRNWSNNNLEYKRMKEAVTRRKNPEPYRERVKRYMSENKEEVKIMSRARQRVYYAIKKGDLVRPDTCEWCKTVTTIEAAHHDYEKPLDIKWLCRPCHAKWDYHEPKIMTNRFKEES